MWPRYFRIFAEHINKFTTALQTCRAYTAPLLLQKRAGPFFLVPLSENPRMATKRPPWHQAPPLALGTLLTGVLTSRLTRLSFYNVGRRYPSKRSSSLFILWRIKVEKKKGVHWAATCNITSFTDTGVQLFRIQMYWKWLSSGTLSAWFGRRRPMLRRYLLPPSSGR
jgi:hypothetical protein